MGVSIGLLGLWCSLSLVAAFGHFDPRPKPTEQVQEAFNLNRAGKNAQLWSYVLASQTRPLHSSKLSQIKGRDINCFFSPVQCMMPPSITHRNHRINPDVERILQKLVRRRAIPSDKQM